MRDLVSIIIVNWNGKKWLKGCLDSLMNQTYKNFEIIFVDNDSNDKSVDFVKKNYKKIKIIETGSNLGLTRGLNIGIKKSKGEFLLLINNDTWVEKDFLEKLHKFYIKNDFAVIAPEERRYDKTQNFKGNTTIDITGSPAYFVPTYSRKDKTFYLSVCFFLSKDVYLKSGGLDEDFFMYNEDVDWFWRLSLLGKKFTYVDGIYIYHAGAGSTGTGIKYHTFLWRNQNTLQTLIKNYSFPVLLFVIPIYVLQNLFEMAFFLLILKPEISKTYIEGWIFNIKNIKKIWKKRTEIQKSRVVGEREILKKMYYGLGKPLLLKSFLEVSR